MREISALILPSAANRAVREIRRLAVAACALPKIRTQAAADVGETQILKWKDGKKPVSLQAK
jgi:hypothetical protein